MRVQIVTPSLSLGGAERIAASMANKWAERGMAVSLAVLGSENDPRHYPLHADVGVEFLDIYNPPSGALNRFLEVFKRHWRIRRTIQKNVPDVVVSHIDTANVRVLLSTIGLKVPIIAAEHTDPLHYDIGGLWRALRRLAYRRCKGLVVLTGAMRKYFVEFVEDERIHVFYNPIAFPKHVPDEAERKKEILYLGRLSAEKGVVVLVKAFALADTDGWRLVIAGDGPDRGALEALTAELGVQQDVDFLGRVEDVYPLLQSASVFVLPSNFEGLPNALCEAMVMGVPSLATSTTGAQAVIHDGNNGMLTQPGNEAEMGKKLTQLIRDKSMRMRFGQESLKLRDKVHPDKVMDAWDALLHHVVTNTDSGGID